jgi:hypothetical protein
MEGSLFFDAIKDKNNFFMELNQKEGGMLKNNCIFLLFTPQKNLFL